MSRGSTWGTRNKSVFTLSSIDWTNIWHLVLKSAMQKLDRLIASKWADVSRVPGKTRLDSNSLTQQTLEEWHQKRDKSLSRVGTKCLLKPTPLISSQNNLFFNFPDAKKSQSTNPAFQKQTSDRLPLGGGPFPKIIFPLRRTFNKCLYGRKKKKKSLARLINAF